MNTTHRPSKQTGHLRQLPELGVDVDDGIEEG